MLARGKHYVRRTGAFLALTLVASLASAQGTARDPGRLAPLTARPATVSLVATLESLSVTAVPSVAAVSTSRAGAAQDLTVTTAWAIRANCTTLRLTGYTTAFASTDFARDPLSVIPSDAGLREPRLSGGHDLPRNGAGFPVATQPTGSTSHPGIRTDKIDLAINQRAKPNITQQVSTIFILAQAL